MALSTATQKTTGFASPAQGYEDSSLDLNRLLISQSAATFLFRLESADMEDLHLHKGSLLIVDRSRKPVFNDFVIIKHAGQFWCRRMIRHEGKTAFTNGITTIMPLPDDTTVISLSEKKVQKQRRRVN